MAQFYCAILPWSHRAIACRSFKKRKEGLGEIMWNDAVYKNKRLIYIYLNKEKAALSR